MTILNLTGSDSLNTMALKEKLCTTMDFCVETMRLLAVEYRSWEYIESCRSFENISNLVGFIFIPVY